MNTPTAEFHYKNISTIKLELVKTTTGYFTQSTLTLLSNGKKMVTPKGKVYKHLKTAIKDFQKWIEYQANVKDIVRVS